MSMATALVCYRPTWRQAVGQALFLAGLSALGAILGVTAVRILAGALAAGTFLVVPAMFALVFLGVMGVARRQGLDVTETGLARVSGSGTSADVWERREVPWQCVADIRTERRGSRTMVRVYLDSGASWRCRAPYDGVLLGRDPEFEQKYFTLRNLWETYRNWSRPDEGDVNA